MQQLIELPFHAVALIVRKARINPDSGLGYKTSFYKFLQRKLLELVLQPCVSTRVVFDSFGTGDFSQSLQKYLRHCLQPDLFVTRTVEIAKSQDEVMIQVADFIARSLARVADPGKKTPSASEIRAILEPRLSVHSWPTSALPAHVVQPMNLEDTAADALVERYCIGVAQAYLEGDQGAKPGDEMELAKETVVEELLFHAIFGPPGVFIPTSDLVSRINITSLQEATLEQLRRQVIAPLRDSGLIISSSPNGYRIPTSVAELLPFVEHANTIVVPMLNRLAKAREQIRSATMGTVDVMEGSTFETLRKLLASIHQAE